MENGLNKGATTAMAHPLDALVAPRSIALVGASARPQTSGNALIQMSRIDGYQGRVYPVNPGNREIEGLACYPRVSELPEVPDHVVLSVPNAGLEAAFDEAAGLGVKAMTIFASGGLEGDTDPPLARRLEMKARDQGIAICGINCMGFYNPGIGLRVASFPSPPGLRRGGIVWLAQSGSGFSALSHTERRLGFTLVVSAGAETVTTAADYMDWALGRPEVRVIGLFLESVRDPAAFVRALEAAAERGIPVVAMKVGRTAASAAMARTHTGAMAGNDLAYTALFRRHGVIQVDDLDEMAVMLAMLDTPKRLGPGGLATMHDSGGEREMLVDMAETIGVPFGRIGETTRARIAAQLDPGLVAENPLDAFGTTKSYAERYTECMRALLDDPDVAIGAFYSDVRDGYWYSTGVVDAVIAAGKASAKPVFIGSNTQLAIDTGYMLRAAAEGVPIVKGTRTTLRTVKRLFERRDRMALAKDIVPAAPAGAVERWRERLKGAGQLSEQQGLELLADFGVPTPAMRFARSRDEAATAAKALTTPLVLKTAAGHAHKSDVGGVAVGLKSDDELIAAYDNVAARLGPEVLVMEMAPAGVEIGLGAIVDPDFGPVVVVSAGGILIEILGDKIAQLAPFGPAEARRLVGELRIAKLLAGVRGKPPADMDALATAISRFSAMVAALADVIAEVDVNPIIAGPSGACAVDCLVIAK